VAAFLFGLPLFSSFYPVQFGKNTSVTLLLPYIIIVALLGFVILFWTGKKAEVTEFNRVITSVSNNSPERKEHSYFFGYAAVASASVAVFSYWLMTYYDVQSFPLPSSSQSIIAGSFYLISLSLAVATGVPFILTRAFPSIRLAIADQRTLKIAGIVALGYFFTYLILVHQIVITGFNTPPGNYIAPPNGTYPFVSAITAGPAPGSQLESAIYVPLFTVQLNQYFNLVMMPFEFAFAIALSILVAFSVALALNLISRSSSNSCYTGATVSGMGSFFGFTATCPTCLAPTLVSVLSGGVSATAPAFYTHLSGVVLPPLVSVLALLVGIGILDYQAGRRINPLRYIVSAVARNSGSG
jgi:hypothetical protein